MDDNSALVSCLVVLVICRALAVLPKSKDNVRNKHGDTLHVAIKRTKGQKRRNPK